MNPLLPIEQLALLFVLLAAWCGWSAWRSSRRSTGAARVLIPLLRVLAVAVLFLVAANPGRWQAQHDDRTRSWVMLLDDSSSMTARDGQAESRWDHARKLAADAEGLVHGAELKLFRFDAGLTPVAAAAELRQTAANGRFSDITGAGQKLLDRYQGAGASPAGIVLITDGRQVPPRPGSDFALRARTMNCPVYPLVLGDAVEVRDLSITTRKRQFIAFAGQSLTVTARLQARHLSGIRPLVELLDATGRVLATNQVAIAAEGGADVRFEFKPAHEGHALYKIRVAPQTGETRVANNETEFGVVAVKEKIRVLLVEGTPYWDSKFIAQLLQRQGNVELSLVYRLTQDRYFSLDSGGALAADNVLKSFPDDAAAMNHYDLVMVGKGFEYFLNPERIGILGRFVREHGGGLVFARGKPYSGRQPDLEALEPVAWEREWNGDFTWQPTESGEEAGLFGDRLPARDDAVWGKLPVLAHAWQGERRKAFAQVLVEGVSRSGERAQRFPAVIGQHQGKGLVVAVNSEDLWQWDFFPKFEGASQLYKDFWLSLVHWSVVYADFLPGHDWAVSLSDQVVASSQSVRVRVLSRAGGTNAAPVVRVARGAAVVHEFSPTAVPGQGDAWEGIFSVTQPGTYRVELLDRAGGDARAFETLTVNAPPSEDDDLSADRPAMEKLAHDTEGRVITEKDLAALLAPKEEVVERPTMDNAVWASAWDTGPCLAGVLTLLAAEWYLRRRNGLT